MMVINLPMSALLLALSIAGFILLSRADRKSGEDRYRVYTCLCGVAGMLFFFYFLANLLIARGLWK